MLFVTVFNTIVILLAIIIHYECLRLLTLWMPKLTIAARLRILVGVIGALAAHIAEIWVFGFAYYLLVHLGHGHLVNQHGAVEFLDYVYFVRINSPLFHILFDGHHVIHFTNNRSYR